MTDQEELELLELEKEKYMSGNNSFPKNSETISKPKTRFDMSQSFGYGDALKNTGKTIVNNLADQGDVTLKILKNVVDNPIGAVGNILGGIGKGIKDTATIATHLPWSDASQDVIRPVLDDLVSKARNAPNKPVDALLTGAVLGAGIEAAPAIGKGMVSIASKAASPINKVGSIVSRVKEISKLNKELPKVKDLNSAVNRLDIQAQSLNQAKQLIAQSSSKDVSEIGIAIKKIEASTKSSIDDVAKNMKYEVSRMQSLLKSKVGEKAVFTQDKVPEFFRNAGKAYGDTQEHIISMFDEPILPEGLLKKGALPISKKEIFDKANKVLAQGADDPLIANSPSYKKVQLMREKYNPESVSPSGLLDSSGNKIVHEIGSDSVDIKNLFSEIRDINKSISSGVRSGSKAISPEDLSASRFNFEVGDILKERIPAYAKLQESYRPVMQAKELAYKIFKPSKGEFANSAQADGFFKRIAFKDKIKREDQALLSMLEEGTTVQGTSAGIRVQGIGDISSEIRSIGNSLSRITTDSKSKIEILNSVKSVDISKLQSKIKELKSNKFSFDSKNMSNLSSLENRLRIIKNQLREREKIDSYKRLLKSKALEGAGIGLIGGLVGHQLFR